MSSILPIGVEDLLSGRAVETARLELKGAWNKDNTGPQILQTLCAFANDLQNLNGGYIVIGVAEKAGVAQRPVRGLAPEQIDAAHRWIRGHCNRIQPTYDPVFSPEDVDGRKILVLWAPPSDRRPHQAPDARNGKLEYWVRIGAETIRAQGTRLGQLVVQLTARVPFDDRRAFSARLEDLREGRVREFLRDVRSGLVDESDVRAVYRHARLSYRINDHEVPRNVALLFFTDDPEQWFRGACIEVAQFADDAAGNVLEEKTFRGPAHEQIRQCLRYLENFVTHHLEKVRDRAETRGWVSYPSLALRESVVNAVYHRSYDGVVEPTKVYLYPNRIEIISYPGPVPGINLKQLNQGQISFPVPARNRRIGELLKELGLAESRNTGVSKIFESMENNGSPPPQFDFDPDRSYFRVTLSAHLEYIAIAALRDAAYLKATGDERRALARIREALKAHPTSALLAKSLRREYAERQDEADVPGGGKVPTPSDNQFLDEIFELLYTFPTLILLAQEDRGQPTSLEALRKRAQHRFGADKTLYLLPSYNTEISEAEFFRALGRRAGIDPPAESAVAFEDYLDKRLIGSERLFLLVTGLDRCSDTGRRQLANSLHGLSDVHGDALQVVLVGGEGLAELKYAQGDLSPLSHAEPMDWPELNTSDLMALARQIRLPLDLASEEAWTILEATGGHPRLIREALRCRAQGKPLDECTGDLVNSRQIEAQFVVLTRNSKDAQRIADWLGQVDLGPYRGWIPDPLLRRLYWKNLLRVEGPTGSERLVWRCPAIIESGRRVLGAVS